MAHSQHSDFDFESGNKELRQNQAIVDPCLTQKRGTPGSPLWCLCDKDGQKVKYNEVDLYSPKKIAKIRKEMEKPGVTAEDKEATKNDLRSYCNHLQDEASTRFKHCEWKGGIDGKCCSKAKGCAKNAQLDSDRQLCVFAIS